MIGLLNLFNGLKILGKESKRRINIAMTGLEERLDDVRF